MKICSAVLSLLLVVATHAQDPSLVTNPTEGIDYPGCYQDLVTTDRDKDGYIRQDEYLGFIQEYGKRVCWMQESLTLQQSATFNFLACNCRSVEGASPNCCIQENAKIPISGAADSSTRTESEDQYLTSVCRLTDATIKHQCKPVTGEREEPPPAVVQVPPPSSDDGLSTGAIIGIIAAIIAALLLLLCCCCCVIRRRRKREQEEEEARIAAAKGMADDDVEMAPGAPRGMDDDGFPDSLANVTANSSAAADEEDEYEDDETRKRRGGAVMPEEDEEAGRRIRGSGMLPPDPEPEPENINLRPPPPKENDPDDEWDYPGRDIDFPGGDPREYEGGFDRDEIDGGVYWPERAARDPMEPPNRKWERSQAEDPDDVDKRKHRLLAGYDAGEVFDKLGEREEPEKPQGGSGGDVFDWVVQSALGVLDKNDGANHFDDDSTDA